jgi:phosphoribosyl 1,2-cyclic phosphodiesterase
VDCGIGPRNVAARLRSVGVRPEEVAAVVVTHEHVDHVRGIAQGVARWHWQVIGSHGTLRALPSAVRKHSKAVRERVHVGGLDLEVIPVSHDAAEPTAYAITSRATGVRAGIAHDLGHASSRLVSAFHGAQLLCIEANHDTEMLRTGPYPAFLKERVASDSGHLSNGQSAAFIDAVATRELTAVLLLHLSKVNNTPQVACDATRRCLHRRARRASLAAAVRLAPSTPIGEVTASQLALAI